MFRTIAFCQEKDSTKNGLKSMFFVAGCFGIQVLSPLCVKRNETREEAEQTKKPPHFQGGREALQDNRFTGGRGKNTLRVYDTGGQLCGVTVEG